MTDSKLKNSYKITKILEDYYKTDCLSSSKFENLYYVLLFKLNNGIFFNCIHIFYFQKFINYT